MKTGRYVCGCPDFLLIAIENYIYGVLIIYIYSNYGQLKIGLRSVGYNFHMSLVVSRKNGLKLK